METGALAPRMVEERTIGSDVERGQQQAFYEAYLAMQPKIPKLEKATQGHGYRYAALNAILSVLRPVLVEHGFTVRWRTWSPSADSLGVRCILRHRAGWYETSEIIARPSEVGGRMSGAQARGALQTYLERYTLLATLGTAPDVDTDAASGPAEAPHSPAAAIPAQGVGQGAPAANVAPAASYGPAEGEPVGDASDGIPF